VRWKAFFRDVAIIFGLTLFSGFLIGLAGGEGGRRVLAIALSNLIFSTIGFLISGCLTKVNRWRHLATVVAGVWILGLINLLFGVTPIQWALSIVFIVLTAAVGGALSFLFVGAPKDELAANTGASTTS